MHAKPTTVMIIAFYFFQMKFGKAKGKRKTRQRLSWNSLLNMLAIKYFLTVDNISKIN